MSVVNRLIRHVFGTLIAPANIQNKQIKTDIGISGSSDRSRFIVKDNFGVEHRFITQDEVQTLIDEGVASGVYYSVYTIVETVEEFKTALELTNTVNIWYDGPTITSANTLSAYMTCDKNIYGANYESINIDDSELINITFPTDSLDITEGTTAYMNFYNGVTSVADSITTSGGIDSNTTGIRLTTLGGDGGLSSLNISTNAPVIYEVNEQDTIIEDGTTKIHQLWSGLNTEGKIKQDTWIKGNNQIQYKDGNIAYNGASIPSTLSPSFNYEFRGSGVVMYNKTSTERVIATGMYFDGSGYKLFDQSGSLVEYTATIRTNGGSTVEYNGAWSGTTSVNLNKTKTTDINGTIAYNGADAPLSALLDEDYNYVFKTDSCVINSNIDNQSFDCTNCFMLDGADTFNFFVTSADASIVQYIDGTINVFNIPVSAGDGFDYTIYETKKTDVNGHISRKGTSIPTAVNVDYMYDFSGFSCKASVPVAGNSIYYNDWDCHNCYPTDLSTFNFIDTARPASVIRTWDGGIYEYNIPSTVSDGFYLPDYETRYVNVDGTIAYDGATIPSDLDIVNYKYEFYKGGRVIMTGKGSAKDVLDAQNAYITTLGGVWRAVNTGFSTLSIYEASSGSFEKRFGVLDITTPGNEINSNIVIWQKGMRMSRLAETGSGAYFLQLGTNVEISYNL